MTSIPPKGDRGMNEVRCPKCKDELQFPFMICPECKWKAKGRTVLEHSRLAETYIAEHPEDRAQLIMVLDMVMKDKEKEAAGEVERSRKRRDMGKKIKVWQILLFGILGTGWIFYAIMIFVLSSNDTPVPVSCEILIANVASMMFMLLSIILLVLKLVSLKK